ncbi:MULTISPECIES: peptidoglycan-binding domain-containing protein [Niastella]|uniref:Peptidoglycan-binding protein n=1 Tax=Niastella soli TaxID=2821487 RepID=A0ABS3Z123_9BACT|nr:peptidoglycan-binding domain-containing protein [Niastella soli]MBO9203872.1 peptidoglycan-binding protein [Niastella soli]
MKKSQYEKEIIISKTCQKGSKGNDVKKIQEWLNIHAIQAGGPNSATSIDSDFGPATELAVKNFQLANQQDQTGIVDDEGFRRLCMPMIDAYKTTVFGSGFRDLVIKVANNHYERKPMELQMNGTQNLGPWVRSYCQGNEGNDWLWCMGFVQTIFDQAASGMGKDFTTLMPLTYSCDVVAMYGKQQANLISYNQVRNDPSQVKPGDIFLVQKTINDWIHTGIIVNVSGDCFETLEGNTNTDGSSNGIGVFKRTRNFLRSKLDVFSIEGF